jgi:septum formation protein
VARDAANSTRGASRLILASASPRRASLLREHGYGFEVIEPPLDEPDHLADEASPVHRAEALSYFKARSAAALVERGTILAGDTIVSLRDQIFGKPIDRADAKRILSSLSGTTHQVITAVTLLDAATGKRLIRHDTTAVTMKQLSEVELEAYLETGAWAGKAGAYGIQDRADAFITSTQGSFTNVVGLPMELVAEMLDEWGLPVPRTRH